MTTKFTIGGKKFEISGLRVLRDGECIHTIANGGSVVADHKFLAIDGELIFTVPDITDDEREKAAKRAFDAADGSKNIRVDRGIGVMSIGVPSHNVF